MGTRDPLDPIVLRGTTKNVTFPVVLLAREPLREQDARAKREGRQRQP